MGFTSEQAVMAIGKPDRVYTQKTAASNQEVWEYGVGAVRAWASWASACRAWAARAATAPASASAPTSWIARADARRHGEWESRRRRAAGRSDVAPRDDSNRRLSSGHSRPVNRRG